MHFLALLILYMHIHSMSNVRPHRCYHTCAADIYDTGGYIWESDFMCPMRVDYPHGTGLTKVLA
jgi:hypothetical protein